MWAFIDLGEDVRLDLDTTLGFQFFQQFRRVPQPLMAFSDKGLNSGQHRVRLFLLCIPAKGDELPHLPLLVKAELQLRVRHLRPVTSSVALVSSREDFCRTRAPSAQPSNPVVPEIMLKESEEPVFRVW